MDIIECLSVWLRSLTASKSVKPGWNRTRLGRRGRALPMSVVECRLVVVVGRHVSMLYTDEQKFKSDIRSLRS